MPQYTLQVPVNGTYASTDYTLQITGSSASGITVKYSVTGGGPWTDFNPPGTATYVPASGNPGTPSSPKTGDILTLVGTVSISGHASYSLNGPATFDPPNQNKTGYINVPGVTGDDVEWQATSN